MSFEFAAVGDNCIDRFMPPISLSLIGGNAVNVAVQLSRLGLKTGYFGAVGSDEDGRRMLACFEENGLCTDHVQIRPGVTAYTNIEVDETGERTFAFEEFGVCRGYRPTDADIQVLMKMRHVHIGWLDDGGDLRRTLRAAGVSVSQDISINTDARHLGIEGLDCVFASAGDNRDEAQQLLSSILERGAKLAVVTCGSRGSMASDGIQLKTADIRPANVVDTTGAGDSFIAGFISAYSRGAALQTCLESGRDAAAETCLHVGGFPQPMLRLVT
ncbi:PfkB family carbohydrate kinase [Microvirga sp. ACRRW]|uniref:PfkB family carbohydrate kinase n=1 Tax=Microvirga sp. ACRRW TaxID=2918205 RepID=UPI001EF54ECD|nr:PfkB family carbohydrate kinase [Microvirga sp. ACRRW]MCG7391590.1 PfkB family carbohydrate kinase [Microvirga sp. ACRRW]